MAGRPSDYSQEIADTICERLADGESLRSICDEKGMPNKATVFRWLGKHEEFRDQYARARETQADSLFDDILAIVDDGRNDWMKRHGQSDGPWVENGEAIRRSQLRVDARKWLAGKLRPKAYGDKVVNEITGKDGGPIQTEDISETDAARRVAYLLSSAARGQARKDH